MAIFLPNLTVQKDNATMPMICPTDMIDAHPLRIGEARAGEPLAFVSVANCFTKPLLAMILALILQESKQEIRARTTIELN